MVWRPIVTAVSSAFEGSPGFATGFRSHVIAAKAGPIAAGAVLIALLAGCGSSPEAVELPYVEEEPAEGEESVAAVADETDDTDARQITFDGLAMVGDFGANTADEPTVAGCGFVVETDGFDLAAGEDELVLGVVINPGSAGESDISATVVPGASDSDPGLTIDHRRSGDIAVQLGSEADNRTDAKRQLLVMIGTPDEADDERGHHLRLDASVDSDTSPYQRSVSFWVQSSCAEPPPPIPTGAPVDPVGDAGVFDDSEEG